MAEANPESPPIEAGRRRRHSGVQPWLIVLVVVLDLPIAWTVLAALGISADAGRRPPTLHLTPTLDYVGAVGVEAPSYWIQLMTGGVIAALAALVAVVVAFLAAYAMTRSGRRDARLLRQWVLVLATVPVMAYVLPLRDVMQRVGLADSIPGLVLAQAAFTAPLALYVFAGFLVTVPRDFEDAAFLDGASTGTVLRRLVAPLAAQTMAAAFIVLFVLNWNQLLIPLVVAGVAVKTVPVAMVDFFTFERELDWPTAAAALTASVVPLLLVVVVFHRYLDRFRLWDGGA